ncbi:hypothetical protein O3I_020250 [Nocardia brasiliensis ATCC 700358]|uniref:Uncharacterized protein n=1 Tax=Nocardia brasiliensis (strain ATCC 700358 / HUJEG-1) TaxID=1133849 RepID=K0EY60_NOCB7|nr:hypothetical protein O3I_020250 [Nocardia brasiliensis ATCC 700358]
MCIPCGSGEDARDTGPEADSDAPSNVWAVRGAASLPLASENDVIEVCEDPPDTDVARDTDPSLALELIESVRGRSTLAAEMLPVRTEADRVDPLALPLAPRLPLPLVFALPFPLPCTDAARELPSAPTDPEVVDRPLPLPVSPVCDIARVCCPLSVRSPEPRGAPAPPPSFSDAE